MAGTILSNAPGTGKLPTPRIPYIETAVTSIHVESLADMGTAWLELCATLAFLADVAGNRADERGLRRQDGIQLSSDCGDVGEIYVRAAALGRCRALALLLSPDTVIDFYEDAQKLKKKGERS